MTKSPVIPGREHNSEGLDFDGEAGAYARLFARLHKALPAHQILLVTTLPRGGTQIAQPASCPEPLRKGYQRDAYLHDRATWQAIIQGRALTGEECWPEGWTRSSFYSKWMYPNGLRQLLVVPISDPMLCGYPGALHFYRGEGQGPFTDDERKTAEHWSAQVSHALRASRVRTLVEAVLQVPNFTGLEVELTESELKAHAESMLSLGRQRQFIFDQQGVSQPLYGETKLMDAELANRMRVGARQQLEALDGRRVVAGRVRLGDSNGRQWAFHTVAFSHYPAVAPEVVMIYCFQPLPCEWYALTPADFQADPELMRLIPTMRFMREEFAQNPTLNDIALQAHLSPFHFHRRFSELLGQTPKQFLLDCQVQLASRLLLKHVVLTEIARRCGFAHQSHFTSRFKHATGLTPTRWRRLAGSNGLPTGPG